MKNTTAITPLTEGQLAENKARYINILEESGFMKRTGTAKLLDWMENNTDFFKSPASTRFHEPYSGGLCEHSLVVYDNLVELDTLARVRKANVPQIQPDSLAAMALLHDLCKANFYKSTNRNVKNEETGKWEKVPSFVVDDQFPYGHGEKSVFLIERFVRLKVDEAISIRWHMGGFDDSVRGGSFALSDAWEKFPHGVLLHMADLQATYLKPLPDTDQSDSN